MGDGPILVRALKLVAEGFRAEIAAILRLRMAARIVLATGRGCATRKPVQVRLVRVDELSYSNCLMHGF